jgi:2-hydroxychromene-2-carboxylate isomerase
MTTVEFFFDISSPWTYLAFDRIERVCTESGADLVWKPFLVGGVFNKVNPSVYQRRENPVPPKDNYYRKDMEDWARYQGLTIIKPSIFPLNSVKCLRGAFVAIEEGKISPYAQACFEAYWRDDRDLSQEEVLGDVVDQVGIDRAMFFEKIADPDIKQMLFNTTDELIERGGYGSPTMFVDGDDMYFGNDRLDLMRFAIERKAG